MRTDGRKEKELRQVTITPGFIKHADGSALIEVGGTRVICTAKLEDRVPPFLRNSGKGWVTAEDGRLPSSSQSRIPRESARGKVGGRTHEIQRLIGRSLRAVVNLESLGERTFWMDCDVIQADGGTRTASITGAYVALVQAARRATDKGITEQSLVKDAVAAVSVGIFDGKILLDLNAEEDSHAEVDMNFVVTGSGEFVEIQGTAEQTPFSKASMDSMVEMAQKGLRQLLQAQKKALTSID